MRSWQIAVGWTGIGETLLRLPRSGPSPFPQVPLQSGISKPAKSDPITPGTTSPANPLPQKHTSTGMQLANFTKSFMVFLVGGLLHDVGTWALFKNWDKEYGFWDCMVLTPFFVLQPFALAFEAIFKKNYRAIKRHYIKEDPKWLSNTEHFITFAWTWIWLGWSAKYWVEGLAKIGFWNREAPRPLKPSLVGGLYDGKWLH
jgi:hypothetical protein